MNFNKWKALIENQIMKKTKMLQSINGLEFYNEEFNDFFKFKGMAWHQIVVGNP